MVQEVGAGTVSSASARQPASRAATTSRAEPGLESAVGRLHDAVLLMGSMVEKNLIDAAEALLRRDMPRCGALLVEERRIKERRSAIESETLAVITTQHPVAGDLRALVAGMEIASELHRMGQYLAEVCQMSLLLGAGDLPAASPVHPMAIAAQRMLHDAMSAYARRDLALCQSVPASDDEVDRWYEQANQSLAALHGSVDRIEKSLRLLRVAHNLERLADRVVNICEWVGYSITGEIVELG